MVWSMVSFKLHRRGSRSDYQLKFALQSHRAANADPCNKFESKTSTPTSTSPTQSQTMTPSPQPEDRTRLKRSLSPDEGEITIVDDPKRPRTHHSPPTGPRNHHPRHGDQRRHKVVYE